MTDTDASFGPNVTPPHRPRPLPDDEDAGIVGERTRDESETDRTSTAGVSSDRTSEFIFGENRTKR